MVCILKINQGDMVIMYKRDREKLQFQDIEKQYRRDREKL
jgi:hypothetical protein